jgi:hypothetical protein
MTPTRLGAKVCGITMLVLSVVAVAVAQDADKQKLIEIEKAFANQAMPGPQAAEVIKQYVFDGSVTQLTGTGRIGTLPKARIVELLSKPDPSDPDVKSSQKVSDFHVDLFGDTALVAYKLTNTDTGHKVAALNTTDGFGCLDTFVKRSEKWYEVGSACSRTVPLSPAKWEAIKKARTQEPKDVQQAYH